MNRSHLLAISIVVLAVIFVLFLRRNAKMKAELDALKAEYDQLALSHWRLLETWLQSNNDLPPNLVTELLSLRDSGVRLTVEQIKAIDSIINLLNTNEIAKAIDEAGRLVGDVLRVRVIEIKGSCEDESIDSLLHVAETEGLLNSHSTLTMSLIGDFRKKVSSCLDVKIEKWEAATFIFSSIGFVYQLTR